MFCCCCLFLFVCLFLTGHFVVLVVCLVVCCELDRCRRQCLCCHMPRHAAPATKPLFGFSPFLARGWLVGWLNQPTCFVFSVVCCLRFALLFHPLLSLTSLSLSLSLSLTSLSLSRSRSHCEVCGQPACVGCLVEEQIGGRPFRVCRSCRGTALPRIYGLNACPWFHGW